MLVWRRGPGEDSDVLAAFRILKVEKFERALDSICAVVAHMTSATTVLICKRAPELEKIEIKGRYGTQVRELHISYALPQLNPANPVLFVPDVNSDEQFSNHPLLELMPQTKSYIGILAPDLETNRRVVLSILNPRQSVFTDSAVRNALVEICSVVVNMLTNFELPASAGAQRILNDAMQLVPIPQEKSAAPVRILEQPENAIESAASETFLFDTLLKKRALHTRNGTDYITIRTWRSALKPYQIAALAACKKSKSAELAIRVATELAENARQIHGEGVIASIVPIPGGSSGEGKSFSVHVAEEIARILEIPCLNIFKPQGSPGKSSPHKSAKLLRYEVTGMVKGPTLIVDDVASSGKHIEMAIRALRMQGGAVYAMAWIGK